MYYVFKSDEITRCVMCPAYEECGNEWCNINGKTIEIICEETKPDWCPLKPLGCWGCPKQHE